MRCRRRSLLRVEAAVVALALLLAAGATLAGVSAGGKKVRKGERLKATLSAANVVPGPGNPDLSGKAHFVVTPLKGEICFDIDIDNLVPDAKKDDPVVAVDIHPGLADTTCGVSGGVVVSLECPAAAVIDLDFANEELESCVRGVGTQLLNSIVQQPGEFYLNVHTASFPAGALRGQLEKD